MYMQDSGFESSQIFLKSSSMEKAQIPCDGFKK